MRQKYQTAKKILPHLQHSMYAIASDKPAIDALLDRAAHADGAEVVKVEMAYVLAGSRVRWRWDCTNLALVI